ncbi:MAG: tetratricopeptide repeat protein [Verrucomicrobiales bacterium]|jgi:tetratricopeptide (TPR) repeat protein|nr:tetratricopeptide repeat protein [Verrucomicrobiales bacterium]
MVKRIFITMLLLAGVCLARVQAADSDPYRQSYLAAEQAFVQNDFDTALRRLDAAEQLQPGTAMVLNLRGAVYVRLKKYDEAQKVFANLHRQDPDNMMALFNLGETYFLQKDYAGALKYFQSFVEKNPAQKSLGVYKVFLCELMTGRDPAAKSILAKTAATPDNPLYFYLNAAWQFKLGQPADARGYLQSAFQIYSGQVNAAYVDSLIELGYVKTGDLKTASGSAAPAVANESSAPDQTAPDTATPDLSGLDRLLPSLDAPAKDKKK